MVCVNGKHLNTLNLWNPGCPAYNFYLRKKKCLSLSGEKVRCQGQRRTAQNSLLFVSYKLYSLPNIKFWSVSEESSLLFLLNLRLNHICLVSYKFNILINCLSCNSSGKGYRRNMGLNIKLFFQDRRACVFTISTFPIIHFVSVFLAPQPTKQFCIHIVFIFSWDFQ